MTRLYLLTSGLQLLAAITAVMVARSRQDYRPVALFLGAMVVANAVKTAIRLGVLVPARSAGAVPFKGWIWAAAQAESALFLSWFAGFAALAVAVFLGRRAWLGLVGWGAAVLVLVLGFPDARGDTLRRYYLGWQLAALATSLGMIG
ncbi:MAG TPA: hypothetical protein VLS89_20715, partial [Candidatus Nanopelagicales bacterium]|nr:hypothetical protein [Candidatus Nanopelagicales bacterium]